MTYPSLNSGFCIITSLVYKQKLFEWCVYINTDVFAGVIQSIEILSVIPPSFAQTSSPGKIHYHVKNKVSTLFYKPSIPVHYPSIISNKSRLIIDTGDAKMRLTRPHTHIR